jgi:hypothetical protein
VAGRPPGAQGRAQGREDDYFRCAADEAFARSGASETIQGLADSAAAVAQRRREARDALRLVEREYRLAREFRERAESTFHGSERRVLGGPVAEER